MNPLLNRRKANVNSFDHEVSGATVLQGLQPARDSLESTFAGRRAVDGILSPPRRGDRAADGDGLENRFRASERGFESHPLRQSSLYGVSARTAEELETVA